MTATEIINEWVQIAYSNGMREHLKHFFNARMVIEDKKIIKKETLDQLKIDAILFIKLNCRDTKAKEIILGALNEWV